MRVLLVALATVALAWAHTVPDHAAVNEDALLQHVEASAEDPELVLLQTQASAEAERVHGYCEICIRMIQMKQRYQPDVCSGLTDNYFITCVKNLESILKADRAVSYWHNVGCVHLDSSGPEAVRPCPAHVICGWVPNIFGQRLRADGETLGMLPPLCPRDSNFVPRVPRTASPGSTLPGEIKSKALGGIL